MSYFCLRSCINVKVYTFILELLFYLFVIVMNVYDLYYFVCILIKILKYNTATDMLKTLFRLKQWNDKCNFFLAKQLNKEHLWSTYRMLSTIYIVHTIARVVFKIDADRVNVVHPSKIHFPPHSFGKCVRSNVLCPRTCCYISINRVRSIIKLTKVSMRFIGRFVKG